jgi:hypothetical protein
MARAGIDPIEMEAATTSVISNVDAREEKTGRQGMADLQGVSAKKSRRHCGLAGRSARPWGREERCQILEAGR